MRTCNFETDDQTDIKSKHYTDSKIKEFIEQSPAGKFGVVLHNDPVNGIDYVTRVIKTVFGYSTSKAVWLMLKAHFTGSSLLWAGPKKRALNYIDKLVAAGPDPAMVHKGAEPLTVSLELLA